MNNKKAYHDYLKIVSHKLIAKNTYEMILKGEGAKYITNPGQFINIRINDNNDPFLRRPLSICEYDQDSIKIIYKVIGYGTNLLSKKTVGESLDCLIGLGNGFEILNIKTSLLIGGGIGVPPLYQLAKQLKNNNVKIITVLGFASKEELFYEEEFRQFSEVIVTTNDGSYGKKGLVTEIIKDIVVDCYYACGPTAMLRALKTGYGDNGYLSLEERMACGIGACMGCSIKTNNGPKRVCVDGPVFKASEVFIND